jgi:hypothetical protein
MHGSINIGYGGTRPAIAEAADGMTVIDPNGTPVRLALSWNDLPGFLNEPVQRMARLQ